MKFLSHILLPLFFALPAHALPHSCDVILKHASVVHEILNERNFQTERGLPEYNHLLRSPGVPNLTTLLHALPDGSTWLDAGAGQAIAMSDFLWEAHAPKLNYLAVTYKREKSFEAFVAEKDHGSRFKYIDGGFIEDLARDPESPVSAARGHVDFITDVFGPLAYSHSLERVLNTYADLLKVGGQALVYFPEISTKLTLKQNGEQVRLGDIPQLISEMTGGRLVVKNANIKEDFFGREIIVHKDDPSVFWLERVEGTGRPPRVDVHLTSIRNALPPTRHFEVTGFEP